MKRFCLWKGHEGSLLHGVLPCILSYPSLPRSFRGAVLASASTRYPNVQIPLRLHRPQHPSPKTLGQLTNAPFLPEHCPSKKRCTRLRTFYLSVGFRSERPMFNWKRTRVRELSLFPRAESALADTQS